MKYYIIQCGADMSVMAAMIEVFIKAKQCHYIMYQVEDEKYLGIEEVTPQEFMNHHAIASNQYFDN